MSLSDYEIARKRVEDKKKFHKHLGTYIIFSLFFFFLNIFSGNGHMWFIYPVLGWGIGIASEYYKVYVTPDLDEKAIQKEMHKLEQQNRSYENERLELEDLPKEKVKRSNKNWDDSDLV
ncbi:MAG: 2TM domain-containing protein [Bacteroidota bacterium]